MKIKLDIDWIILISITSMVCLVSALYGLWVFQIEERGEFGDMFGGLNALFSGLAFGGILVSLMLQKRELIRQKEEQTRAILTMSEQSEIMQKTLVFQAYEEFMTQYRSAEMLYAVSTLWNFYRDNKTDFVQKYLETWEEEKLLVAQAEDKELAQRNSLHYQRRLVSQFYSRLGVFVNHEIFPSEILYDTWNRTDLEIIPKILVPIENSIRRHTQGIDYSELDETAPLMILYNSCP